jgi:type VI secretion system protein ImpM
VSAATGSAGFFGKLPARGDFVRDGLPGSFVGPWDDWLRLALAGSRDMLGSEWLDAWMEAPVWRFALAPGLCGTAAALGVMLPSVDRAGRYFPLTFATLLAPEAVVAVAPAAVDPPPEDDAAALWLDRGEIAGRAALEQGLGPEQVAALLPAPPRAGPAPAAGSLWWTSGAPRVAAGCRRFAGLPDAADFASMLTDAQPAEPPA